MFAQVAGGDPWSNPAVVAIVGAIATTVGLAVVGVIGWLIKRAIDNNSSKLAALDVRFETLDGRFDDLKERYVVTAEREAAHDHRIDKVESGLSDLRTEVHRDMGVIHGRLDQVLGRKLTEEKS